VFSGEVPPEISTSSSEFGKSRVCSTALAELGNSRRVDDNVKAEQKDVMPKGCRRNMHFGSKTPTINFARNKAAKELPSPQIPPFQDPSLHAGLAKPLRDSTASFQTCKALPLCSVLNPRVVPVPSELPAACCRAAREAAWVRAALFRCAADLGKDLHKMPSPLQSPKQDLSKTSVMPGMSCPAVN